MPSTDDILTVTRPELLVDGSDYIFRQFIHDQLAFATRLHELSNRLGRYIGLSGTQYLILLFLKQNQQDATIGINQIAEHLHLSGAFTTIEVNKLVASGLVRKVVNPEDRRRVVLTLSEKAYRLIRKLAAVQQPTNDLLFESLSSKDFARMCVQIQKLVVSADKAIRLLDYASTGDLKSSAQGR